MLRLAAPLALAELGWMAMGVVDTVMAGPLGAAAMGAGSLGAMVFYPIAICGTGMLLGMDTLVAQAFGAGDPRGLPPHAGQRRVAGAWRSRPLVALAFWGLIPLLRAAGANPRVMALFGPYLQALVWGMPAAAVVRRLPPLPAGGGYRQAR